MNKMKQKILCIESTKLFSKGKWNGLKDDNLEYYFNLLLNESEFRVRGDLEEDPSFKQIIPQIILRYDDKYFLHKQVNANETRLNDMYPLPLGGHVEEFDLEGNEDVIQTALMRELSEEVELNSRILNREFLGLVYLEDENPVNHVHVGLMYIFDLDSDKVKIKEKELEEIGFVDKSFLVKNEDKLTYWSRVVLDKLVALSL